MAGTSPAMTKKRLAFKLLARARKCRLLFGQALRIAKEIGAEIQANFVLRADKVIE
jgi:hypothetical protein